MTQANDASQTLTVPHISLTSFPFPRLILSTSTTLAAWCPAETRRMMGSPRGSSSTIPRSGSATLVSTTGVSVSTWSTTRLTTLSVARSFSLRIRSYTASSMRTRRTLTIPSRRPGSVNTACSSTIPSFRVPPYFTNFLLGYCGIHHRLHSVIMWDITFRNFNDPRACALCSMTHSDVYAL